MALWYARRWLVPVQTPLCGNCSDWIRCWIIEAKFGNEHINYQLEQLEKNSFLFFFLIILTYSAQKCIFKHIFFLFSEGACPTDPLAWTACASYKILPAGCLHVNLIAPKFKNKNIFNLNTTYNYPSNTLFKNLFQIFFVKVSWIQTKFCKLRA